MVKELFLLSTLAAAAFTTGCTKEGPQTLSYGAIERLDIVGAEYLYTTRGTGTRSAARADDNSEHLFKMLAGGLILFTMTDRAREKRFRCEIRDGVYSETEIVGSDITGEPEIISFVRIN